MQTTEDLNLDRVGPVLFARGGDERSSRLGALVVLPQGEPAPKLVAETGKAAAPEIAPHALATMFGRTVWLYDFALPSTERAAYRLGGERFEVEPVCGAATRIAYVSCNGQEEGDWTRDIDERDIMWTRLARENEARPFALMLQGGDQLYADDVTKCHREVEAWWALPQAERADQPLSSEGREAMRRFYFDRYCGTFARPAMKALAARVPSVMMWDDHDIVDGWGSYPQPMLEGPIGRGLFESAREMFLLFQLAATEGAMLDIAFDPTAATLGIAVRYPKLSIIAPDLRSERRLDQVMADAGWKGFSSAMQATPGVDRLILMSSVPALGPRLSWVEAVSDWTPGTAELEDDLRDQWQSRTHRKEWKRLLIMLAEHQERYPGMVTVVSGEIHLATRGELTLQDGTILHQLVASGISHPAPHGTYPKMLGFLARLGESPLPKRKSRLRALPGQTGIYVGERNYLVLEREDSEWTAEWELEDSGRTPSLML